MSIAVVTKILFSGISHLNVALKDILPVLCNCLCDSMSRSWGDQRTQFSVQRTVSSALFDLIGDDGEVHKRLCTNYSSAILFCNCDRI